MFNSISCAKVGTWVQSAIAPVRKGRIVGYGFMSNELKYLVQLDTGVYTEDRSTFIDTIVMDPSVCEEIE